MNVREMEAVNGGETIGLELTGGSQAGLWAAPKYLATNIYNYLSLYSKVIFKSQIRINGIVM
jgi:hypothetical protein